MRFCRVFTEYVELVVIIDKWMDGNSRHFDLVNMARNNAKSLRTDEKFGLLLKVKNHVSNCRLKALIGIDPEEAQRHILYRFRAELSAELVYSTAFLDRERLVFKLNANYNGN